MKILKKQYEKILKTEKFSEYTEHKDVKLRTIFFTRNPNEEIEWIYCFSDNSNIYTFSIRNNEVLFQGKDQEYSYRKFFELNLDDVKISYNKMIEIANTIDTSRVTKEILTLSNSEEYGIHWNLTRVTSSLDIINIKINQKGQIISHTSESLMKLGKWVKGENKA